MPAQRRLEGGPPPKAFAAHSQRHPPALHAGDGSPVLKPKNKRARSIFAAQFPTDPSPTGGRLSPSIQRGRVPEKSRFKVVFSHLANLI